MQRHEVPAECLAVRCANCNEWLAVMADATDDERRQVGLDHRLLCRARVRSTEIRRYPG